MKRGKRQGHRNFTPDEHELIFIEVLEGQGTLEEKAARMTRKLGNRSYSNMLVRMQEIEANIHSDTLAAGGSLAEIPSTINNAEMFPPPDVQYTLTADELILRKLKETFERNGNITDDDNSTGNVWVMLVTIIRYPSDRTRQPAPRGTLSESRCLIISLSYTTGIAV